jgi:N-acetylglucosamine-6-sulfatase
VSKGIEFSNAISEDPLCCPARANLLTGLHTHNNGVNQNDARLFRPQEHVGAALKEVGYASMWIGKYMNKNSLLSATQWQQHMAGWTVFDGIYGWNGDFKNYTVKTKQGNVKYPTDHSTKMVGDRAVMRMREVAPATPIFQVLSIYNMHGPNTPMPLPAEEFAKCNGMEPWWTPAFNEEDVSDKPAYIANLPQLKNPDGTVMTEGWPMDGYCREMLGIEHVVTQVTDELEAQGRLDNTLLIFTSDNGNHWGSHRRGQQKNSPFATPIPLYMSWPARWGSEPRVIDELTTNIDLAPTFCDIAGCNLGPYPTGQQAPDGVSLLPLIDEIVAGGSANLGRDAVLERGPAWSALRTTKLYDHGLWHYVEHATGERELYDLSNGPCHEWQPGDNGDPCELNNKAGDPAFAERVSQLAPMLQALRLEGAAFRPDVSLSKVIDGTFKGDGIYAKKAKSTQTRKYNNVPASGTYDFYVRVDNDSTSTDSLALTATSSGAASMPVSYWLEGTDVTAQITGPGLLFENMASLQSRMLLVRVTVAPNAGGSDLRRSLVSVTSTNDPSRKDVVRAVVAR